MQSNYKPTHPIEAKAAAVVAKQTSYPKSPVAMSIFEMPGAKKGTIRPATAIGRKIVSPR